MPRLQQETLHIRYSSASRTTDTKFQFTFTSIVISLNKKEKDVTRDPPLSRAKGVSFLAPVLPEAKNKPLS